MINLSQIASLIILLGAIQGLFLAALVVRPHRHRQANALLAALLVAYSWTMIFVGLWSDERLSAIFFRLPHLAGMAAPLPFLFGPLHYLYVRIRLGRGSFERRDLQHFLPFVACIALLAPFYLESADFKRAYLANLDDSITGWHNLLVLARLGHAAVYSAFALRLLRDGRQREAVDPSTTLWLRWLTGSAAILWALTAGLFTLDLLFADLSIPSGEVAMLWQSMAIYALGYVGLRSASSGAEPAASSGEAGRVTPKYARSGLDPGRALSLVGLAEAAMEKRELFRNEGFDLASLAAEIGASPNHLSQALNQILSKNFHEFINGYRVRSVMEALQRPAEEGASILSVAYDVGFRSKSAFYAAFKKSTGLTPSEFRKRGSKAGAETGARGKES